VDDVYFCGFTSEASFGAWSYLIVRPQEQGGNVLVDSPRFNNPLVKRIEQMGGVNLMLLSHRDDIADHAKFAAHFHCPRVMHEGDSAAARGIELTCSTEPLPAANGDRLRIGQVIDNLVSNALKFTPAGGTVEVRAYPHHSAVRIEVADTGMGISEDEQGQLFERFFRTARAQEQAIPGVGLGLSISKAIVEAHGGRVSVSSIEGAGTTFFVDLPAVAQSLQVVSAA
jgi:signal transduction histidine kinase